MTRLRDSGPTLFAIVYTLLAYSLVHGLERSMTWFPLLSAIFFPMLVMAPFLIFSFRIWLPAKIILIAVVGFVMLPVLGIEDTFYFELIVQIGIFAAMGVGLNIVIGFAGLLDLGYIAFFAVGAYLWGIFTTGADTIVRTTGASADPSLFWLFIGIGVIAAAVGGVILGLPVLRLRGDYLAVVTLGFGEIIRILVSNLGNVSSNPSPRARINITNGAQGLDGVAKPPLPEFFFDFVRSVAQSLGLGDKVATDTSLRNITYQLFFYLLVLAVGGLAVIVAARLDNSPIGRAWTAIREDETAAVAMGVPRVRMKLLAFAIGASFAGAMGTIFAAKQTFVSPESFSFTQSIFILVIVIVGGMGSIRGVLLGAVVVTLLNLQVLKNLSLQINALKNIDFVVPIINFPIKDWPSQLEPARYERFVFGILLILMMIFRPAGILPAKRRKMEMSGNEISAEEMAAEIAAESKAKGA
jgi:branched-chain amino acid transport system permease protein